MGAYGVDGGDIDLILDGSGLEERFPVGASLGGPCGLDGDEVCALLGGFAEQFREPQVVADERSYFPICRFSYIVIPD